MERAWKALVLTGKSEDHEHVPGLPQAVFCTRKMLCEEDADANYPLATWHENRVEEWEEYDMQVHAWELRKATEEAEIIKEMWDKPPNFKTTLGFSHSLLSCAWEKL